MLSSYRDYVNDDDSASVTSTNYATKSASTSPVIINTVSGANASITKISNTTTTTNPVTVTSNIGNQSGMFSTATTPPTLSLSLD